MTNIIYGFVDENNILKEYVVIDENNLELVEQLKTQFGYPFAYRMDWSREVATIGSTYWNGYRFVHPSPYRSWLWNEEINDWISPVPYPADPSLGQLYEWNEDSLAWVRVVSDFVPGIDLGPICQLCGINMRRAGTCYVCESCGATTGCS